MFGSGQTGAYAALSLIAGLWGSCPACAKLALVAFPPLVLVTVRCSIASLQAILGAITQMCWHEAVHAVGPSCSAVFMNLQPVVDVLLAWAILGERITASGVLG